MLPSEQEAEEVARGDGLDLRAQPPDRVMMDAREQATVAPLLVVDARKKRPLRIAPSLSSAVSAAARPRFKSERRGQRRLRDGPKTLEPAAQDLDQRLVARPCRLGLVGGRRDLRLELSLRP